LLYCLFQLNGLLYLFLSYFACIDLGTVVAEFEISFAAFELVKWSNAVVI